MLNFIPKKPGFRFEFAQRKILKTFKPSSVFIDSNIND